RRRRRSSLRIADAVDYVGRRLIALDQILRDALGYAGHAFREHRLALAGQLLLGVEKVASEPVGGIDVRHHAAAAAQRQRERRCDEDDASKFRHHCVSQLPLPAAPSAISISTRARVPGGVWRSVAIISDQRLNAAVSPA